MFQNQTGKGARINDAVGSYCQAGGSDKEQVAVDFSALDCIDGTLDINFTVYQIDKAPFIRSVLIQPEIQIRNISPGKFKLLKTV